MGKFQIHTNQDRKTNKANQKPDTMLFIFPYLLLLFLPVYVYACDV